MPQEGLLQKVASELVSAKFIVVYVYLACVTFVHFRGRERLRFMRQLSEHSGLFSPYNVLMYLFSAVPKKPILSADVYPQLAPLKANWKVIRDEAQALFEGGHIDYKGRASDMAFVAFHRRGWKRFYLRWYDDFLPSARLLCPRSVELVSSIPGINAAAFTMLPPGTELGRHRDPFAGSLRYHLGLITPNSDDCGIWVDGEYHAWRDGEDLVFDETYVHWARNDTDQNRIIFFADVTRPLHTPIMRGIGNFMNRYVFKHTHSRNVETDPIGALNRVTPIVYWFKFFFLGLKEKNRRLYYAGKYVIVGSLVALIFAWPYL